MSDREIVKTHCPRDCYDSCGIVVIKRDGRIARVLGDPDDAVSRGALCGKCAIAYNGVWLDAAARLTAPLRRTGAKGGGQFEPVGWDEALADIARRLNRIIAERGPASIFSAHYTGTCSVIANGFPNRFFNHIGATEVEPDTVCNNAGHVALNYVIGTAVAGFDPRTIKDAKTILLWGVNPSATAPHAHKHWLGESGAFKIVIDPVRHETAAAADLHLQLRPGSDSALAYALAHVLLRDGLIDRSFIAAHTVGWDEIEPIARQCTPQWGEQATGIAAAVIERAARAYGRGPSLMWLGQGLQRQPQGGNVFRAAMILPAITGNVGKPGAGIYYLNGKGATRGIDMASVSGPHLRKGPARSISHMDLAANLADPANASALFVWNMNIAASAPNQLALRKALQRDDLFTVVIDPFMTDSAQLADYVLPAASFLEFDDLVGSYFHLNLAAQNMVAEPMGQSLPNQEIFRRLARAMGLTEPALFEADRAILDRLVGQFRPGLDFAALAKSGAQYPSKEPAILHQALKFATPSGKIELASAAAQRDGHPRIPHHRPDAAPGAGRLRLLSPASKWLMNSSYGNDARIGELLGPPRVVVHPEDAARLGLRDGQKASMATDLAAMDIVVECSDRVRPGTALTDKSRWPSRERAGINVNALNPGLRTDMGDSTALHGVEVSLTPA